ncbi:hypothetical protein [Candidatus Bathycorpusculum sp.]|uniref:hypothetical protein n=1 Tax=Candidatus Bathycorpusculum sp. TaxID=2994959 RepID=UPI00282D88A6|nr:hypothetical protein [Candidatus Termitimicrobium sp.]
MRDGKNTFNILSSIEKHIESLKPLLPKQLIVCIGEYPIKTVLKQPTANSALPIFIEKSSEDIYKWIPHNYTPQFVRGFEDEDIDTHFWYDVLPAIAKDSTIIESLKNKPTEKLRSALIFASVWDGVGSAAVPSLTSKFRNQNIDSLSMVVLPSKIQPADAHFNAYASLQMCLSTKGSTVLLLGRDELETFEGLDREGTPIKGKEVVNYLLSLFLAKELLVPEITELARTFDIKMFGVATVTAVSYRVYGSLKNMLNVALLKPLLSFELSKASLLYVLLRMPSNLKEQIPRTEIELAITMWFKEKTSLQSIHITEPIYTEDMSDRIDMVLFIGGFDINNMFGAQDTKVQKLKNSAVEKGYITKDWQLLLKVDEPKEPKNPTSSENQITTKPSASTEQNQLIEEPQTINKPDPTIETTTDSAQTTTKAKVKTGE